MMKILVEGKYGHGAIKSPLKGDEKKFKDIAGAMEPFDWSVGVDIEEKIGVVLPVKNQGQSFSCGGQAWSYMGEVLAFLKDKTFNEKSAKFIYAQTFVPGGGSNGIDNCKLVEAQGLANEAVCTSYMAGNTPTEAFMEEVSDITSAIRATATIDEANTYEFQVVDVNNIDTIALAINYNNGVILGITGQNNGSWLSAFPTPPSYNNPNEMWGHWLVALGAKMINGVKYIKVKNSWGSEVGENGVQWLSESFFIGNWVFNAWSFSLK